MQFPLGFRPSLPSWRASPAWRQSPTLWATDPQARRQPSRGWQRQAGSAPPVPASPRQSSACPAPCACTGAVPLGWPCCTRSRGISLAPALVMAAVLAPAPSAKPPPATSPEAGALPVAQGREKPHRSACTNSTGQPALCYNSSIKKRWPVRSGLPTETCLACSTALASRSLAIGPPALRFSAKAWLSC